MGGTKRYKRSVLWFDCSTVFAMSLEILECGSDDIFFMSCILYYFVELCYCIVVLSQNDQLGVSST